MKRNSSDNPSQKMSIYMRLVILSVIILILAIWLSLTHSTGERFHGIIIKGDSVKSQKDYSECVQKAYVNQAQSAADKARAIYNQAITECNRIPHTVGVKPN